MANDDTIRDEDGQEVSRAYYERVWNDTPTGIVTDPENREAVSPEAISVLLTKGMDAYHAWLDERGIPHPKSTTP